MHVFVKRTDWVVRGGVGWDARASNKERHTNVGLVHLALVQVHAKLAQVVPMIRRVDGVSVVLNAHGPHEARCVGDNVFDRLLAVASASS